MKRSLLLRPQLKASVIERVIYKDHLLYWLRQLRNTAELIAPVRRQLLGVAQGETKFPPAYPQLLPRHQELLPRQEVRDVVFETIENIHEISLENPAIIPSAKEFLFPKYEPMFHVKEDNEDNKGSGEGNSKIVEGLQRKKRIIFGVRSCDISAFRLLDRFFLFSGESNSGGVYQDPYYRERRENTIFISIVCNSPDPECFCIGLGTGPYLLDGFDIQLTDLSDRYYVRASTAKGIRLVRAWDFLFGKPKKTDADDEYEVFLSSKARFQKGISLTAVRDHILSGRVKDDFWRSIAEYCFECGGCVYECPLCTCFTVTDRRYPDFVERARIWDACLFKGFTKMAGGVLPHKERYLRTKRWFYHKLIYYPETVGDFGCVGCGRCAITCPGRIDMATIAKRLMERTVTSPPMV